MTNGAITYRERGKLAQRALSTSTRGKRAGETKRGVVCCIVGIVFVNQQSKSAKSLNIVVQLLLLFFGFLCYNTLNSNLEQTK